MNNYLPKLEILVNRCLQWDPQLPDQLKLLDGKAIRFIFLGTEQDILVQIHAQQIHLSSFALGVVIPDLTISATPLTFLRAIQAPDMRDITIQGDASLAQTIQTIMRRVEFDWEHQLAQLTGNVVAHRVSQAAHRFHHWAKRSQSRLKETVTDWLQEEIQVLPSRYEIDDWCDSVDTLRDDTERLLALFNEKEKER